MADEKNRVQGPDLFDMTDLTGGRAGSDRTTSVASFTVKNRHLKIAALAAIPGLFFMAILWLFMGIFAIFGFLLIEAAAFILVEVKTNDGLGMRLYRRAWDTRRAHIDEFRLCGVTQSMEDDGFGRILQVGQALDGHPNPYEVSKTIFSQRPEVSS